jgi:sugar phosphate isomerase/epimerase
MIGVGAGPMKTVELAENYGFAACDISINAIGGSDASWEQRAAEARKLSDAMKAAGIFPGSCGGILPGKLSVPDDEWDAAMEELDTRIRTASALGFDRTTIVMLPFHEELPFDECFALHVKRCRQAAAALAEGGIRLGIEYVSQKTRRAGYPHEFIYDLKGTLRLIDEIGAENVGVLLDSFHWFCAGENLGDIRALTNDRVVVVHVNDSIAGRSMEEQVAFERKIPGATGIIDLAGFLGALRSIDYDGPVTAEPMDKALNEREDGEALAAVARAMADLGI